MVFWFACRSSLWGASWPQLRDEATNSGVRGEMIRAVRMGLGVGILFKCSWGKQQLPLTTGQKTLNTNSRNLVRFSLWEELVKNTDSRFCSQTFWFFKCRKLSRGLKFCRCYRRFWYKWSKDHILRFRVLTPCKAAQPANLLWGECTFYRQLIVQISVLCFRMSSHF